MEMIQLDYELRNKSTISLLESTRKKEHEEAEAVRENRKDLLKTGQAPPVEGEEEEFVDVLLEETAHIAADLVKLMESQHSSAFGDRNFQ